MKPNKDKVPGVRKTTARKKVIEAQEQIDAQTQVETEEFRRRVACKAYELYAQRGYKDGYHQQDWAEAERIIRKEMK